MKDRQPTNAGRVQLVPVAGQMNIYDMSMSDGATEQGTPLNKATFLKDATAALYGLTNTAVPDDVFSWLGKFNEHCWARREVTYVAENKPYTPSTCVIMPMDTSTRTFKFANSIMVNPSSGAISLVNPITKTFTYYELNSYIDSNKPFYFSGLQQNNDIYYLPSGTTRGQGTTYTINASYSILQFGPNVSIEIMAKKPEAVPEYGDAEYVYSTNRSAYPDDGIAGGYKYEYLGIPFDKLPTAPKIEFGSYVGTGVFGVNNKNIITFDKKPKLVKIYYGVSYAGGTSSWYILADFNPDIVYGSQMHSVSLVGGVQYENVSWSNDGKTLQWYNTQSAANQLNEVGTKYYYYAIY